MEIAFTYDAEPVCKQADMLFAEWLTELPDGALREHVHRLSQSFRNLNEHEHSLIVVSASSHRALLTGYWLVDGRCEIIGPYVRPDARKQGIGKWGIETACFLATMYRNAHVLTPASEGWMIGYLEEMGFLPTGTYVPDGPGDHLAFHADLATRSGDFLRSVGEPRGRGSWSVVLLNDDETPFNVVTAALQRVLDVDDEIATHFAALVHHEGSALLRHCLTERSAKALAHHIERFAITAEAPLRAIVQRR